MEIGSFHFLIMYIYGNIMFVKISLPVDDFAMSFYLYRRVKIAFLDKLNKLKTYFLIQ